MTPVPENFDVVAPTFAEISSEVTSDGNSDETVEMRLDEGLVILEDKKFSSVDEDEKPVSSDEAQNAGQANRQADLNLSAIFKSAFKNLDSKTKFSTDHAKVDVSTAKDSKNLLKRLPSEDLDDSLALPPRRESEDVSDCSSSDSFVDRSLLVLPHKTELYSAGSPNFSPSLELTLSRRFDGKTKNIRSRRYHRTEIYPSSDDWISAGSMSEDPATAQLFRKKLTNPHSDDSCFDGFADFATFLECLGAFRKPNFDFCWIKSKNVENPDEMQRQQAAEARTIAPPRPGGEGRSERTS